jgi:hypothetical protein
MKEGHWPGFSTGSSRKQVRRITDKPPNSVTSVYVTNVTKLSAQRALNLGSICLWVDMRIPQKAVKFR